jgi:hypothetical protein
MTTSSAPVLRPLTLGELLDQAIRLYRRNFLTFIGIIAVVQVPLMLLQLIPAIVLSASMVNATTGQPDPSLIFSPQYWLSIGGSFLIGILSLILLQGVAAAALTRAIADNYLGHPVGILDSYRRIGSTWPKLVWALLSSLVLTVVLAIWMIIPCIGWITGPGLLIFFSAVIMPLIAPVVILERFGVFASILRAWNLARRRFWWMIGFVLIMSLFSYLIIVGPTYLVSFIAQLLAGDQTGNVVSSTVFTTIIQSLASLIGSLIYSPLQLAAMTLVYFDLRVRTEGLDLAMLTASAAGEAPSVDTLIQPESVPSERLITSAEIGSFIALSIGFVVLYFLFVGVIFAIVSAYIATIG